MNGQILRQFWKIAAVVLTASVAFTAVFSGWNAAVGIIAGGLWNLLSLWVLSQLLNAWLGPNHSTRRAVSWIVVKFPLLYLLAFGLIHWSLISIIGFTIGFSIILITAIGTFTVNAMRMNPPLSRE
ncbi:MAG: hypothetical protein IIA34_13010 [Proteobacteria bacterium]|nr:hypothetical protein [Pseudomonadota bacterium]